MLLTFGGVVGLSTVLATPLKGLGEGLLVNGGLKCRTAMATWGSYVKGLYCSLLVKIRPAHPCAII